MVHYRGLLLLAMFTILLSTLFLQPGEARKINRGRDSGVSKEKKSHPSVKNQSAQEGPQDLGPARVEALRTLYEQMKTGAPVSDLEAALLSRFADGDNISSIEADTVISRALYDFYVRGLKFSELTAEQQSLLAQYKAETANQPRRIDSRSEPILLGDFPSGAESGFEPVPLAPPSNDQCAGALAIPGAGPFPVCGAITADITESTTTGDPPTPSCQTSISRSVWYSFTPSTTGFYRLTTCADQGSATTVDDTVMAIYTSTGSCAGPFTEVPLGGTTDGCDDDTCISEGLQSVIETTLTGGQTYYVVLWKFGTSAPTAGNTAVQPCVQLLPTPPTPANDTCATATSLTLNIPSAGATAFAANDYQLSGSACFTGTGNTASTAGGRDVVYSFTAPSAGQYSFRAWQYTSTGTSNVVAYVASTCPPATPGTPVTVTSCLAASNFQGSTGGEEINCLSLAAGQQVFFYIDEAIIGPGGNFYALVESCGPMETEPNNTPATASPLSCGIQGQVNPATEADFYSIGTPATGSRLFAMVDASTAGPSADVDLRVNSATDTIEYDDLDSDIEFGVSGFAPIIAGTMATGIPLFYQVDRFGAAPTGNAFPYRLYSVVQPTSTSATPETEPNNSIAMPTVAVNNYFSGALAGPAPSIDVDIYAFNAVAGDLIMLILDGDPTRNNTPVDTRLQLLDSAGAVLVDVDGSGSTVTLDNANPPGLFETVPTFPSEGLLFRATTNGTYYARVSAAVTGATGVGDYLLSITKNCTIGGGLAPTAELTLTKTDSPDPVFTGSNLTYTITLTNAGPLAASNVTLTDVIPTGTTFVSFTAPAGWTSTTPAPGGTGTVTATNPSFAPGTAMFTLVVNVNAPAGATITNTATVTQSTAETNTADNVDTETTMVTLACSTPPTITGSATLINESCPPANGVIDPDERVTVNLNLTNNGTCPPGNLIATLVSGGGVNSPSDPQSYGSLAGGASAGRDFTFTASGSCGGMITATWQLTDGTNNLGTVTQTFPVGCATGCGIVRLVVTSTLMRVDPSTVKATYQVQNTGTITANNVQLTTAQLGATNGTPLVFMGSIAPGASSPSFDVFFTNSTPGASSTLRLNGTYTGGTFASTKRVTIP